MVGGVIAHPFAKLLWVGLMPELEPHDLEHMHCVMPSLTGRSVAHALYDVISLPCPVMLTRRFTLNCIEFQCSNFDNLFCGGNATKPHLATERSSDITRSTLRLRSL